MFAVYVADIQLLAGPLPARIVRVTVYKVDGAEPALFAQPLTAKSFLAVLAEATEQAEPAVNLVPIAPVPLKWLLSLLNGSCPS